MRRLTQSLRSQARIVLVLSVLCPASITSGVEGYSARCFRTLEIKGGDSLAMPTSVAVDIDGNVFVADGANDRIVRFGRNDISVESLRSVGPESLSRPIGVKTDSQGRLWIADTGRNRVVVRKRDGSLDQVIVPRLPAGEKLDATDLIPSADGRSLWLVDNDHHRLARLVVGAPDPILVGRYGGSLGQFAYPFSIATNSGGDLFVVDVVNGRVQMMNSSGQPVGNIGGYGVDVGELYRPKGVAIDEQGLVWVSDSALGVVQIFTSAGQAFGPLRDDQGKVFRFETPLGLAFDSQGKLYVVESRANRVRVLEIVPPARKPVPAPQRRPRIGGGQSKTCTVCHLEWIEPFKSGRSTELADPPLDTAKQPYASRPEVCFGCHDGSVADSRRRIWLEQGHKTGVAPPARMKIPAILPLVDDKLACRTCHSAHGTTSDQPVSADIATTVFLRMPNEAGQLCMSCHSDKVGGPAKGTHPVGGMPWPIPKELVDAGARSAPNPREISCVVCHTPHGSKQDHLLVMATQSSQLCLTCHSQLRPGLWRPEMPREHPQNPPLSNDAQREAIKAMGTKTGSGDTLICLSCHKLHHGQAANYLLADTLHDSRLCLRCHPDRGDMAGSAHDLRGVAPAERNRLGQTPAESGPCGACHSFHQFARRPSPSPADPTGLCSSCHAQGQCAAKVSGQPMSHPQTVPEARMKEHGRLELFKGVDGTVANRLACLTCHNPHQAKSPHFLKEAPDSLCENCHKEHLASMGGAHDFTTRPELKNSSGRSATETGKCGFCHAVHNAVGPVMWSATSTPPVDGEDGCLQCHKEAGLATQPPPRLRHPTGAATAGKVRSADGQWPLFNAKGELEQGGSVGCGTCHDLHGNSKDADALLRHADQSQSSRWCLRCHADQKPIEASLHSESMLKQGMKTDPTSAVSYCGPCHSAHERTPGTGAGMWSGPIGPSEYSPEMRRCLGCHAKGGAGPQIQVTIHPIVPMRNDAEASSGRFLPLVNQQGQMGGEGRITCQTCHLPHGRSPSRGLPAVEAGAVGGAELRAMGTLLRPYSAPNLCSGCHGFDGLRKFLYYHYPEKRKPNSDEGG